MPSLTYWRINMKIRNILITIKKELRSIFRDKKTFIRLLILPLSIPLMVALYSYIYSLDTADYSIGVNYQMTEIEQSIVDSLNLDIKKYNSLEEMKEAYDNEEISVYVDLKDNKYTIYADSGSSSGVVASSIVTTYLDAYKTTLADQYFESMGADLDYAYSQVNYEMVDVGGNNYFLVLLFSVCFSYITMAIVTSTSNMAISATAQEKESGTLETLLTFPIKTSELVTGKYIAGVLMGILSGFIGLALTVISLNVATGTSEVFDALNFSLSLSNILLSVIIVISASIFIGGLAIALTSSSKSFKEAQSSTNYLTFITMIPMFTSILNVNLTHKFYLIPIANYTQILMDIFSNVQDMMNIFIVFGSTIIYTVVIIYMIVKLYKSEKILFG
jgi:sodium transport system permease protein